MAEGYINQPDSSKLYCTFDNQNITSVSIRNGYPVNRLFLLHVDTKDLDTGYTQAELSITATGDIVIYGFKNGVWTEIKRYS